MARDSQGTYTRPVGPYTPDTVIDADAMNAEMDDIATALTASLAADGQTNVTANLSMSNRRHIDVGRGIARTEYGDVASIQDSSYTWCGAAGGTADAIIITPAPAILQHTAGQRFVWKAVAGPNTGAMTFQVGGLVAKPLKLSGENVPANVYVADRIYEAIYDGEIFHLNEIAQGMETPDTVTDASLVRYDGTSGRCLKNGAVIGTDVQAYSATLTALAAAAASPAEGDLLYYTGTQWKRLAKGDPTAILTMDGDVPSWQAPPTLPVRVMEFTASGTWDKPANLKYVRVTVVGGGGGGGGSGNSLKVGTNARQSITSVGAGGGGGGSAIATLKAAVLSSQVIVTVGAGGAGGTVTSPVVASTIANDPLRYQQRDGAAGGTSSFGTHCVATGGRGGATCKYSTIDPNVQPQSNYPIIVPSGAGGTGSTGNILATGQQGPHAILSADYKMSTRFVNCLVCSGGGGAVIPLLDNNPSSTIGTAGTANSGGGGSGSLSIHARSGLQIRSGGNGGSGIVIVEEFF